MAKDGNAKQNGDRLKRSKEELALIFGPKAERRAEIKCVKPEILETEKVFLVDTREAALEILKSAQSCRREFITLDDPSLAPRLPTGFDGAFRPPLEVTPPRQTIYFIDAEGKLREMGIETRQRIEKGRIKQTTKRDKTSLAQSPALNRAEQHSYLCAPGFNVYALGEEVARKMVKKEIQSPPRPALRIIAQRERMSYFPDGNPEWEIELAVEPIHLWQSFDGAYGSKHKIDLEIKRGPEDEAERLALLQCEEDRLLRRFERHLTPEMRSSAADGFDHILSVVRVDEGKRKQFERIDPRYPNWIQELAA